MQQLGISILVVGSEERLEYACKTQHLHGAVNLEDYYRANKSESVKLQKLRALLNRSDNAVTTIQDQKTVYVVMDKKNKIESSRQFKMMLRFIEDHKLQLLIKQIGKGFVLYHYDHYPTA